MDTFSEDTLMRLTHGTPCARWSILRLPYSPLRSEAIRAGMYLGSASSVSRLMTLNNFVAPFPRLVSAYRLLAGVGVGLMGI